jgi:hypothetical protein
MSKCKFYRQCNLERPAGTGTEHKVCWIPEQYAVVDSIIQIKEKETWLNGWKVKFASEPLAAEIVEAMSRNHLKQRSASDVIFADIKKANEQAHRN